MLRLQRPGRERTGQPNEVVLEAGQPAQPTWFYAIDNAQSLQRLDRGEVTFGTLAGKARQSDQVTVDADFMPGYEPGTRAPAAISTVNSPT